MGRGVREDEEGGGGWGKMGRGVRESSTDNVSMYVHAVL